MELDCLLNEKYFTSDFYNNRKKKDKLYDIYVNPTVKEIQEFVPKRARAWIDPKGNFYVEGVPPEDQMWGGESENYLAPEHVEFVQLIHKTLGIPQRAWNFYFDFIHGYPAYLVNKKIVYIAYMVEDRVLKWETKIHELSMHMKRAAKKNPNLTFVMKRGG